MGEDTGHGLWPSHACALLYVYVQLTYMPTRMTKSTHIDYTDTQTKQNNKVKQSYPQQKLTQKAILHHYVELVTTMNFWCLKHRIRWGLLGTKALSK